MPPNIAGTTGVGGGLTDVNASGIAADRPAIGTVDEDFVYYATDTGEAWVARSGAWVQIITTPVTDHGALGGLADDDHTQYTTTTEAQALVDVHTGDTVDAHDASAVSIDPSGLIVVTSSNVQAALAQLDAAVAAAGGASGAAQVIRTAGNLTLASNQATWAELAAASGGPGTGGFDLTLAAAVGDVLILNTSLLGAQSAGTFGFFDVQTIVSGSPVNSAALGAAVSNSSQGVSGWILSATSGNPSSGGFVLYKVQAGDVSAGNVKLRLMYQSSGTGPTVFGTTSHPLAFSAINMGAIPF